MHQNRRNMWLARSALVLGLWGGVTAAEAVGLGKMTILSALDEPLRAEIELTAASAAELKRLNAGLAPRAEFESAGIDRPAHLFDIKYTVSARSNGQPILKLSTEQPVREPFLHFLLQLDWSGGRLIREYTALLDPPHILAARAGAIDAPRTDAGASAPAAVDEEQAAAPASETLPQTSVPALAEPTPAEPPPLAPPASAAADDLYGPTTDTAPSKPTTATAQSPASASPGAAASVGDAAVTAAPNGAPRAVPTAPAANTYGPVKSGETLAAIVRRLPRDPNISAEQAMLALVKHNRSAFIANNVNGLRTGKVLTVPAPTDMGATAAPQAARQIRAQYNSWQEYKLKLANVAQVAKQPSDGASAKGAIAATPTSAPAAESAPTKGANTELLKIVRAGTDASGKGSEGGRAERQALTEKVATLEEVISSKELENKELRERVTQLEAQVKNAKRLMEIENKDLAKAQNQAAKPAPASAAAAPAPSTTPAQAQAPGTNDAKTAATPPAPAGTAAPTPAAPKASATPAPKPAPVPPAVEAPSLWDSLSNNSLLLPVAGALLAVLAGGLLIYYRRRRQALAEFGESILSGGLNLNSEGTPANPADANGGEVSFLSDFSQGGMGNIHTDEVDPIAEAEVYLAYGRDEQAEEILKEAVIKDPARHELRLKLLEIYHQRNDVGAFETVAEELYAALQGKGGKIWEAVEEMGYKMNPDNPMFRAGAKRAGSAATATAAAAMAATLPAATANDPDLLAFDLPQGGNTGTVDFAPQKAAATATDTPAADSGSDFSFDLDFSTADNGASGGSSAGIDFGAELADTEAAATDADPVAGTAAGATETGIDFDFSSFAMDDATAAPANESTDSAATLDFNTESLDMSAFDDKGAEEGIAFEASALDDGGAGDAAAANGDGEGGQIDETATKLDLAKAYIDMGDADGARSILDEVLAEGNDTQRRQAAALAAQIAA